MNLYIAEKPSLAKAIAANFSSCVQQEGFIEVAGGDIVSWCYGHILENAMPEDYDPKYKVWSLNNLPIRVDSWKVKPVESAKSQLALLGRLIKKAKVVINAGDPDREGQLLVDEVLVYHGWNGATKRLLLNATDPGSVKKAMGSMRDNNEFKSLYNAALCRSRADWLVGMNLTCAASKVFGSGKVVSVGRVQTPTLALVVRRDLEIEQFKVKPFYYLVATMATDGGILTLEHNPADDGRIEDKKIAQGIANKVSGKEFPLTIEKKKSKELAPLPYMLATFQKDAESELGLRAKDSLDVLQTLYEAKLTSYPRSDCEYLPGSQSGDALKIANAILDSGAVEEARKMVPLMKPSQRIYDSSKVAEHHGIVPTGRIPQAGLPAKAKAAWLLVCKRFIASLLPDYEYEETVAWFDAEGRRFKCAGEIALNMEKSWRGLIPKKVSSLNIKGAPTSGRVTGVEVKAGKTTPPKHYTESSLIADMRGVAKYITDPALKKVLKETSGIGTAATQAATIETLKKREMVKTEGKWLKSTEFGRMVITRLPKQITDPGVTAAWESTLGLIAEGKYNPDHFMNGINSFIKMQIDAVCNPASPKVEGSADL